jgi:hypothetical protein
MERKGKKEGEIEGKEKENGRRDRWKGKGKRKER